MEAKLEGNRLTITVDLTPADKAPLSSTGKSKVLFSSGGFAQVAGLRVSLNVIPGK